MLSDKDQIYAHTVIYPRNYDVKYLINVYADKFERRNWDWFTVLMLSHEFCHIYFYEEADIDKVYLFHWLLDYLRMEWYEKYYPMKRVKSLVMTYDIPALYAMFKKILQECGWQRDEKKAITLIENENK